MPSRPGRIPCWKGRQPPPPIGEKEAGSGVHNQSGGEWDPLSPDRPAPTSADAVSPRTCTPEVQAVSMYSRLVVIAAAAAAGILVPYGPQLVSASIFSVDAQSEPQETAPFKGFSGLRAYDRSKRVVYWHDQTIAVIELGPNRLILNCELIEVYEPKEREETLSQVSKFSKPHRIKLDEMIDLMDRCTRLETPPAAKKFTQPHSDDISTRARGGSSLFSGVIPGTKWCGTGDIADTYFDLGEDEIIDRCCRTHDLCPSKVRGHSSRYNYTNDNMYTKSHCKCDAMFQKCLRNTKSSTADIMGHFYFDLLKIPCIDDRGGGKVVHSSEPYSS